MTDAHRYRREETGMDVAAARDFIRANPRAVLGTYRRDGRAQLTPVVVGVDDDGLLEVSTSESTAKARNVRRDPRVTVCALTERFFGSSVQVQGEATILSLPDAMEPLVTYYRRLSGEHPDWEDYWRAMVRDRRCLLKIRIEDAAG
jgi:PPOX class probable F420-dependent enzyme